MSVLSVVFDVGETLLDDSREFGAWADWIGVPRHIIATSAEWGVAKPDAAFFAHVIDAAPGNPGEIVYVGDHRDNDLVPAKAAGLCTAHIRRGPWGHLWADDPRVAVLADWRIRSLTELPSLLAQRR